MSLPPRFSERALTTTAARMTAPEISVCQNGETLMTGKSVDDDAEEQGPEQRAGDRADAAGDRHAADHAGGDDR